MTDYLTDVKKFHATFIEPYTGKPVGCSHFDINTLQNRLNFKLPEAYQQYLAWIGRDYKGVFRGSDCFVNHVLQNNKYLPDLLASNNLEFDAELPYVAFFCHQGYECAWFTISQEQDDPDVYFFGESDSEPHIYHVGRFTDGNLCYFDGGTG